MDNEVKQPLEEEVEGTIKKGVGGRGLADPKNLAGLIVLALLLGLGLWRLNFLSVDPVNPVPAQQGSTPSAEIMPESVPVFAVASVSYNGVEGKTALELLKSIRQVETQSFGDLGEFVSSIDGRGSDAEHFWSFYLNGAPASVGAGSYVTKSTDVVEWKYEAIK